MSDKLLQLWESTIAASLQRNLADSVTSLTPIGADPLVKVAKDNGLEAIVAQNTVNYPALGANIPTRDDPLVRLDNTIDTDLKTDTKDFLHLTAGTPKTSDPLVIWASQGGPEGQGPALNELGINTLGYETLGPNTPSSDDPLWQASFKSNNGLPSPQQEIADKNPYSKSKPYSSLQTPDTLLFAGTKIPSNLLPPEGQLGGDFEGGSLYHQGGAGNVLATFAPIASKMPGTFLNSMDIFALAQWARNIGMEFGVIQRPGDTNLQRLNGIAKGAAWLASQFLLSTFNPADPQNGGLLNLLYAPTSFPASFIPGLRGNAFSSPNTPAVLSVDGKVYSTTAAALPDALDRHLLMRQGLYVKQLNASDIANGTLVNYPGYIGDIAQSAPQDGLGKPTVLPGVDGLPIAAQVDQTGLLGKFARAGNYMVNMYTSDAPYSAKPAVDNDYIEQQMRQFPTVDAETLIHKELFKDSGFSVPSLASPVAAVKGLLGGTKTANYRYYFGQNKNHVLAKPTSFPDFDAYFTGEGYDGTVPESDAINDDDLYMPFTFQDLRDTTPSLLYFKAFLKEGLTEQFQPNWQSDGYYGRVDQVPTYTNTSRVISVGFDVVAWHPKDLPVIWRKLTKLQSMVYPTFDSNNYLNAGPMVRMRIGDLFTSRMINNVKKGLPGYINSLTFSYDDGIWNIRKDWKLPRKISVALGFVVVHDGNPGLYPSATGDNIFGTLEFRNYQGDATDVGLPARGGIRGMLDTINVEPDQPILPEFDNL